MKMRILFLSIGVLIFINIFGEGPEKSTYKKLIETQKFKPLPGTPQNQNDAPTELMKYKQALQQGIISPTDIPTNIQHKTIETPKSPTDLPTNIKPQTATTTPKTQPSTTPAIKQPSTQPSFANKFLTGFKNIFTSNNKVSPEPGAKNKETMQKLKDAISGKETKASAEKKLINSTELVSTNIKEALARISKNQDSLKFEQNQKDPSLLITFQVNRNDAQTAIKQAKVQVKELTAAIKENIKNEALDVKKSEQLGNDIKKLEAQIQKKEKALATLIKAIENSENPSKEAQKSLESLSLELAKLKEDKTSTQNAAKTAQANIMTIRKTNNSLTASLKTAKASAATELPTDTRTPQMFADTLVAIKEKLKNDPNNKDYQEALKAVKQDAQDKIKRLEKERKESPAKIKALEQDNLKLQKQLARTDDVKDFGVERNRIGSQIDSNKDTIEELKQFQQESEKNIQSLKGVIAGKTLTKTEPAATQPKTESKAPARIIKPSAQTQTLLDNFAKMKKKTEDNPNDQEAKKALVKTKNDMLEHLKDLTSSKKALDVEIKDYQDLIKMSEADLDENNKSSKMYKLKQNKETYEKLKVEEETKLQEWNQELSKTTDENYKKELQKVIKDQEYTLKTLVDPEIEKYNFSKKEISDDIKKYEMYIQTNKLNQQQISDDLSAINKALE